MRIALVLAFIVGCCFTTTPAHAARRVAVQPFGGPDTEPLRRQVAGILGRHGYRVLTSLAQVSGTSQYPGIAKEKNLVAFVVGDVVGTERRISLSLLIWQGVNGSVVGRWEVAGSKKNVSRRLAKEFWKRLGPTLEKSMAPPSDVLPPAPTMRINAGTPIADSSDPS